MEIIDFIHDVATDIRSGQEAQRLARRILNQWNSGLIPSPKEVKILRKLLERTAICGRIEADGSCVWLRRNAKSERLRPPLPGQRVYCRRRASGKAVETFLECNGYREKKA